MLSELEMSGELSGAGWTGLIAAIGAAVSPLIALICGWIYKMIVDNNKTLLEIRKIDASTARAQNARLVKEQATTIKEQAGVLDTRSQEVHSMRNEFHALAMRTAAAEATVKLLQQQQAETEQRLQDCEDDRANLWKEIRGQKRGES